MSYPAAPPPPQLTHKYVGYDDAVTNSVGFFKLKLGKISMKCLDGSTILVEEAGGKLAILEFRLYACATKNAEGKVTAAFIGGSLVSATELADTPASLAALPPFKGSNASDTQFSIPAAGSGATRSPDLEPDAAAADVARPLVRDRDSPPAKTSSAAKRTRARPE